MQLGVAQQILDIGLTCEIENRYEAKSCNYLGRQWEGFNDFLNRRLGGMFLPYPPGAYSGICDVVLTDADNKRYWIEVKFCWTYSNDVNRPNSVFHKHLFSDEESALKDVRDKLATLIGHRQAGELGFLLVCLFTDSIPLDRYHIAKLEQSAGLNKAPWVKYELPPWRSQDPNVPGGCVTAYYWQRPAR